MVRSYLNWSFVFFLLQQIYKNRNKWLVGRIGVSKRAGKLYNGKLTLYSDYYFLIGLTVESKFN
jgi:hypothetical protein